MRRGPDRGLSRRSAWREEVLLGEVLGPGPRLSGSGQLTCEVSDADDAGWIRDGSTRQLKKTWDGGIGCVLSFPPPSVEK